MPSGCWEHVIVWPLYRAVLGIGVCLLASVVRRVDGLSGVLGSAVPKSLPVPLHNPVQGLEAVSWWESGVGCSVDCLSRVC